MAASPLLRRNTLWTMRPHISATLGTQCEAQPNVFAYQVESGAAPLPSVAATVSPEQQSTPSLLPLLLMAVSWLLSFLLPQQEIIVLILVSQLVPRERETFLELTTQWDTAAMATSFWWGQRKGCVRRTANGVAVSQRATVRLIPTNPDYVLCHVTRALLI